MGFFRPSTFRLVPVVAVLLALSAASAIGDSEALAASRYPAPVRRVFVDACARTAVSVGSGRITHRRAVRYCTLALTCISKRLTLKQFARVVTNMQTGARNPQAKVFTQCEKSAAKALGV
jgi:hypothetical protein